MLQINIDYLFGLLFSQDLMFQELEMPSLKIVCLHHGAFYMDWQEKA